jgi:hypothetical protein
MKHHEYGTAVPPVRHLRDFFQNPRGGMDDRKLVKDRVYKGR